MNFHMSDDGPKPCSATKKPCPVGGEHGTEEEIQKLYDEKMNSEYSIPKMTRSDSDDSRIFDSGTFYDDGHQVKIRNAFQTFKDKDKNGGSIEIEEGDSSYDATAFYNDAASGIEDTDKTDLGFNAEDTLRPFVNMASKRNIIWLTPGIEVNGTKQYENTYRYEVENGEDLKKMFDISQSQIEDMVFRSLEDGEEIAGNLKNEISNDVIDVGEVKDIQVRHM